MYKSTQGEAKRTCSAFFCHLHCISPPSTESDLSNLLCCTCLACVNVASMWALCVCVCVCVRVTQFLLCFFCPSHPLLLFIFSLSLQPVSFNNPQLQPTPWRTSRKARRSSLSAALSATPLRRYVSLHTNLYLSRSRSRSVLLTHTRSPLSLSLSR